MLNQKQRSVMVHDFAMNPRSDVPRSAFPIDHSVKMPFSFSYLVPLLVEEVLPGDVWKAKITVAARTAVPIVPIQDNWKLEFFSFFVPQRLLWTNAPKFWGEQDNPADSISYTIPQLTSYTGGYNIGTVYDYMGLPTAGQVGAGNSVTHNALPLRAYNLIWNDWFRDENLQNSTTVSLGDGPDALATYANGGLGVPLSRGKRFDYFTQALPWPQKGNTAITVPIGSQAIVRTNTTEFNTGSNPAGTSVGITLRRSNGGTAPAALLATNGGAVSEATATGQALTSNVLYPTNLYADLANATGATINSLRTSITLQQYLEKDARGGTRYTEFVYNHFGVRSPDARLQRPEFIGGGSADINTTAIPQSTATGLTGGSTPLGTLAASGHVQGGTGFTYAATEHGYILTLVSARADLTYQQGLRKMWSRSTRYDYPVPLLAGLGEQSLLNREIYCDGSANDANVFGYVPRWDEYRYIPSQIKGLYRSTAAGTIDYWHSSQKFAALPTLNSTFITDDAKTVTQRNFAAGAASANQQILGDFLIYGSVTRALPAYGTPGLTRI